MLEGIIFIAFVLPYILIGKVFKNIKKYCLKKDWIFLYYVADTIGYPFSLLNKFV